MDSLESQRPVQDDDESDDDYAERLRSWQVLLWADWVHLYVEFDEHKVDPTLTWNDFTLKLHQGDNLVPGQFAILWNEGLVQRHSDDYGLLACAEHGPLLLHVSPGGAISKGVRDSIFQRGSSGANVMKNVGRSPFAAHAARLAEFYRKEYEADESRSRPIATFSGDSAEA